MDRESLGELSNREREILRRVATGATNQQIALDLDISINTVKAHLRNIFGKLGVESRTEATLYAIQQGLVQVARPTDDGPSSPQPEPRDAPPSARTFFPPPHMVHHPTTLGQRLVLLLCLAAWVLVAVWPDGQSTSASRPNRLVDTPRTLGVNQGTENASRWQAKAQMPTPRIRFAQAQVDGLIYVIGGQTDAGWSAQVQVYDPRVDQWDRRAAKPTPSANIGAAVVGGRIYVPGGLDPQNRVLDLLEVYDPRSDTWTRGAPLPLPVCLYAIAATEQGLYVLGGWDGQRYLDTVLYYDVQANAWRREAPLRTSRGLAAAASIGGRVYIVGGYDGAAEYRLCESFDPALAAGGQEPWRTLAPLSVGRAGHSLVATEGSLYVVGGGFDSYLSYNERYDVANDVWSTFDSPLVGEWRTLGLSAITAQDGASLYAIGGWSGGYLSVVQAYRASYRIRLP